MAPTKNKMIATQSAVEAISFKEEYIYKVSFQMNFAPIHCPTFKTYTSVVLKRKNVFEVV